MKDRLVTSSWITNMVVWEDRLEKDMEGRRFGKGRGRGGRALSWAAAVGQSVGGFELTH